MKYKKLTHKYLKEILKYNPETGDWFWKVSINHVNIRGERAGRTCGDRRKISIHSFEYISSRLAWFYMEGYWPEHHIDHIDRNTLNDKWSNLRHASVSCNMRNKGIAKNNNSGIIGVCWNKSSEKWQSYIYIDKRSHYLGTFDKLDDAVKARWDAEVKYEWPTCNTTSTAFLYLFPDVK